MTPITATSLAPSQSLARPPSRARARSTRQSVKRASFAVWRPPGTGANPLEDVLASAPPIEGLGALTGYWFLDVFAMMNVALLIALVATTSDER